MPDPAIHVVAGVLRDGNGRVLLAQRPAGKDFAGMWEFPGGKCQSGETPERALQRELQEELGIVIGAAERVIGVPWRYADKSIYLDAYSVRSYAGTPHGGEGQALRWASLDEIPSLPMPPADVPVVSALRLPARYVISAEPGLPGADFLATLERVLKRGNRLIQLRSKMLPVPQLREIAFAACELCRIAGADLLLNGHVELARELDIGVHLPAADLLRLAGRPLGRDRWVGASCHDEREVAHAAAIGADFAVIGPVRPTASHEGASPIGWQRFARLCSAAPFPVFALGGVSDHDLGAARSAGAHGIAGVSAFWN